MRPNNCKVLEAVDEGLVDAKYVMEAALAWMSDDEIKDMCLQNDILIFDEDKICDECGEEFDDNDGESMCKTCEEWIVTE